MAGQHPRIAPLCAAAALLASRQAQGNVVSHRHIKPFLPDIAAPECPEAPPEVKSVTAAPTVLRKWHLWSDTEFAVVYQSWLAEGWPQHRMAAELGCNRSTLYRRVARLGLPDHAARRSGRSQAAAQCRATWATTGPVWAASAPELITYNGPWPH